MSPEETLYQLLGLGKLWPVVDVRDVASILVLTADGMPDRLPDESTRGGTLVSSYDHVEPMQ